MTALEQRIASRLARVGAAVDAELVHRLTQYYLELGRWSRRINLTAFDLTDGGGDEAIDRLLVEPVLAARFVPADARSLLDVGSGGGSPGIPIYLARPQLSVTLVESRGKKAAFLRHVARHLESHRVAVQQARFEELAQKPPAQPIDCVSIRAVEMTSELAAAIRRVLTHHGLLLWFVSREQPLPGALEGFTMIGRHDLLPGTSSQLLILESQTEGASSGG